MEFLSLHHVGISVTDMERAKAFYIDVLGLAKHPLRSNWLCFKGGNPVHLMPVKQPEPQSPNSLVQHFALQVERLENVLELLLQHGLQPFQREIECNTKRVSATDDPLNRGIGILVVEEPDGNIVEFVQVGCGIFRDDLAAQLPAAHQPSTPKQETDNHAVHVYRSTR